MQNMKSGPKRTVLSLALMLCMLLTPVAARMEMPALSAQIDALLGQMGFDSIEDAMEAYDVDSADALLALYMQGKLVPPETDEGGADTGSSEEAEERTFDGKVMATMEMEATAEEIKHFFQVQLGIPIADFLTFPTANEALLALKSGKVDTLLSMDATATFMAQQDPTLYAYMDPRLAEMADISLSMVVTAANEALGAQLNEAIAQLKEDGTLALLAGSMLGGQPPAVPEATLAGEPLRVGVTGDIPPVDYVDEAGNPAGYNVNLMQQIAAVLGRPVEFTQVNKGAAITALMTNRIDILFWQEQALSEEVSSMVGDLTSAVFLTDPYLEVSITAIELK